MKKLLLFFGLICMINLMSAQETVTIHQNGHDFQVNAVRSVTDYPASNIQFWVGNGSNSVVAVFKWCQNTTMGIAYGYRWDGSATIYDMLTGIAAADSRFTVTFNSSNTFINNIMYQDDSYNEYFETDGYCTYTFNGGMASGLSDALTNNGYFELEEWGDCYPFPTTTMIVPATDPNGGTSTDPVDASLPFSQILYWVGSGSNSAEFIVNFAQPDTAFAWGYRFDGTTTAQAMVDAIAAADPRFWTVGSPSLSGDIHFVLDNGDTLGLSPVDPAMGYNFWWTNLNGVSADAGAGSTIHNNDVFKYGDMNSAIGWDPLGTYFLQEAWVKVPTPVTPPAAPVEPDTLCTTVHPLTYSENFSSYTSDQSIRPHFASAPIPECWTVLGNGTVHHVGTGSSTTSDYFGGVGYSTSTNSFGAIAANDAFFSFIASQIYTGTNTSHINDMLTTGTRRYAVLPTFDSPLSQTVLTFDHRTNIADANTHLVVGYIVNDTADFVALETYTADNKVLHHDTIHFNQYANVPATARLTLMWDVASTTASTTGPGNRYCGIDNLTVALDVVDTTPVTPVPEEATIDFSEILYWVGTGSNEAVMAVNWADTALAWGYRWDGTATVADMMAHIAAADPRFSYSGTGMVSDINYIDTTAGMTTPLGVTPGNYWESKNNGFMDAGMGQTLANGDFEKWADPAAGIVVDSTYWDGWGWSYTYVYPMTIYPVTVPDTTITPVNPDPEDATISADAITYWVGTGNTEVIFVGNWCSPEVALAWGVRFDGTTTTVEAVMDTLAAYDSRFGYSGSGGILNDVTYQDANYSLTMTQPSTGFVMYNVNGTLANFGYTNMYVTQGDLIKVGNTDCATQTGDPADWTTLGYAWQTPIVPVSAPAGPIGPTPEEATIDFSEILYWVGTGSNEAVMAVNWADTALAWGYRWDGAATVADMMAHIAAADPRFSYSGTGMVSDINYIDTAAGMNTPLGITPGNWWGSTNNGVMDMGMAQTLNNGDLEKWADSSTGILVDSVWVNEYGGYWNYIYVYPMTIYPVTVPDTTGGSGPDTIPEHGPFCGAVGTDGCNAIAVDDNQFVAWATNVVLTRGPQNISNPNSPLASFGDETNAIGPATPNNSMEAVSLGDGGSALVTFERPIRNGEGPDFAVFENDINGGFLELAFVEVSSDGVHFVRFPATSLTQTETQTGSFAFTDPTFINNLAGKFQIGYGTPFDLEELADSANLNIDSIVYVRIIDVVGNIDPQYATYDAFGHIVNDPWPTDFASCGFDLTGVGVIHQKSVGIESHEMPQVFAYPNPCTGTLYIINENAERVELYNLNGKLLQVVDNGDTHVTLNMQSYPAGLYLLKVGNGVQKILNK
ncbi:MAG: T9SS type A sorting domain-containing protein [Bacteroidales bacterium]|nr:T9SS type A sorting domain-containing protein [Bacteroidales bacterium]